MCKAVTNNHLPEFFVLLLETFNLEKEFVYGFFKPVALVFEGFIRDLPRQRAIRKINIVYIIARRDKDTKK